MKLENYSVRELEEELEKRKKREAVPDVIVFDAYLFNDYTVSEWIEYIEETTGYLINDELARIISNNLYEVKIPLMLDTMLGEVIWLN